MAINWKIVGALSSLLIGAGLVVYAIELDAQRSELAGLARQQEQNAALPLVDDFAPISELPRDPVLHCFTLPAGIRLAPEPTSTAWMDQNFGKSTGSAWAAISERMRPGDDVYAFGNIPHPPPGVTAFTGVGGGYVVLRGWCLVGAFHTWVE